MAYKSSRSNATAHVATLWLANPSGGTPWARAFWDELPRVMDELVADERRPGDRDRRPRPAFHRRPRPQGMGGGIVESGSGAGARKRLLDFILKIQRTVTSVARCEKPVIAVAHGYCIGGGIDLLTRVRHPVRRCRRRLQHPRDAHGDGRRRRHACSDCPASSGEGQVAELAFSGDDFGAERRSRLGLREPRPSRSGVALAAAQALAARIAANSPLAVTGTKRVLEYCADKSVEDGLTYVATWNAAFVASEDLQEAMTAFFEKRPPTFRGR